MAQSDNVSVIDFADSIAAGYGKMPDYEQVFIDFFMSLPQAKHNKRQCVKSGIEM